MRRGWVLAGALSLGFIGCATAPPPPPPAPPPVASPAPVAPTPQSLRLLLERSQDAITDDNLEQAQSLLNDAAFQERQIEQQQSGADLVEKAYHLSDELSEGRPTDLRPLLAELDRRSKELGPEPLSQANAANRLAYDGQYPQAAQRMRRAAEIIAADFGLAQAAPLRDGIAEAKRRLASGDVASASQLIGVLPRSVDEWRTSLLLVAPRMRLREAAAAEELGQTGQAERKLDTAVMELRSAGPTEDMPFAGQVQSILAEAVDLRSRFGTTAPPSAQELRRLAEQTLEIG